jgi:hypothetical protein
VRRAVDPFGEIGADGDDAITTGGDPICRSNAKNLRLDTSDARAFYGRCLALP